MADILIGFFEEFIVCLSRLGSGSTDAYRKCESDDAQWKQATARPHDSLVRASDKPFQGNNSLWADHAPPKTDPAELIRFFPHYF